MVSYGVTLEMLIGVTIPRVGWWSLQERNENPPNQGLSDFIDQQEKNYIWKFFYEFCKAS